MKKNNLMFLLVSMMMILSVACKKDKGETAVTSEAGKKEVTTGTKSTYAINKAASVISWEGYKVGGTHNGTIDFSTGNIEVADGKIVGGDFVIDMNTLNCLDLTGDKKAGLEAHLKGTEEKKADHFFNTNKYPTSKLSITKTVGLENNPDANTMVYANLTMRDKTHQIGFKANVDMADNMVKIKAPKFNIDRTKWDIKYNSKSIYKELKDNIINDEIGISVNVEATK